MKILSSAWKILFPVLKVLLFIPVILVVLLEVGNYLSIRSKQAIIDQVQEDYQGELERFYEEHRVSLDLVKEYINGTNVFLLQTPDGTWSMQSSHSVIDKESLEIDVAEALENLILTHKISWIEGLPDGVRFEFKHTEDCVAVCILYTNEKLKASKYWGTGDFLRLENIAWLNEDWYISIGYRQRW